MKSLFKILLILAMIGVTIVGYIAAKEGEHFLVFVSITGFILLFLSLYSLSLLGEKKIDWEECRQIRMQYAYHEEYQKREILQGLETASQHSFLKQAELIHELREKIDNSSAPLLVKYDEEICKERLRISFGVLVHRAIELHRELELLPEVEPSRDETEKELHEIAFQIEEILEASEETVKER